MTKLLQKKFTVTAMTAITVLILVIVLGITTITIYFSVSRSWENLRMITEAQGDADRVPRPAPSIPEGAPKQAPPDTSFTMRPNQYDIFMSQNFFTVRFDRDDNFDSADVRRTSTVSEEDARSLAETVLASGKTEGRNGRYFYRVSDVGELGRIVVFLDIASNMRFALTVLIVSLVIGIICWGLMLPVTLLLSKKAILPIAENIERQKQFVTNAGHEIKTPLAIIMSNTEAMELYVGENKWSRNIKEQTSRLSMLMKELLSLAKMDEGSEKKVHVNVDISECLKNTLEGFSQFIENKSLVPENSIGEGICIKGVQADCEKLCSILLDNAVKYSDEGGRLAVKLAVGDKGAVLSVENTCDEVPDVPVEKLFDRFYRSDRARTQKSGGCGIGLSMAQAICDSYGWKIRGEYIGKDTVRFEVAFGG